MAPGATVFRFPTDREPWVGKQMVAEYLGRSQRWVEHQVRAGMPSRMIGGRRSFRLSEVDAWIDSRQPS